tara:strand:- start:13 stop:339 length:327 start_codon:yes stop_codon:yes gene_type:complete
MQRTRFSFISEKLNILIFGFLRSSWREKSINLLSIFLGYFLFTNIITNYISRFENKIFLVPIIIILFEMIIRFKPSTKNNSYYFWLILDKLRIGGIYALILEAFKLGS